MLATRASMTWRIMRFSAARAPYISTISERGESVIS